MAIEPERGLWGHVYLWLVIAVGAAVIGSALLDTIGNPPGLEWFTLAALTLLTGSFTVKVPSLPARFSVSETFVFASGLLFGPAAGTLTVVLDALVISFWLKPGARTASRVLFNVAAPSIGYWIACSVFFALVGISAGDIQQHSLAVVVGPLFAFAFLYFLVNTWLVAIALAWERNLNAPQLWLRNFSVFGINYFVGGSIAILLVAYTSRIDLTALSVIVPLLLISYITFRSSMGRLEDANRHIAQVNEMYMATIETLAMAIDAKDQITHGHIRRVQVYTVELARRLGVSDDRQLKAIAAAALLHDMGKLAIPEHILNKPGRLTGAEFDRMKQHASLGADLLASVRFPYPAVPIVRHHHENWDGSGYPSRISRTDIPLGARILSVVDCFDALTSDRPYRPRLTADEAFAVLRERRGSMYDPLVVDTFIQAYPDIAPKAIKAGEEARTLVSSATKAWHESPMELIRANASEAAALVRYDQEVTSASTFDEAFSIAVQYMRQLTPASVFVFYRYDPDSDSLVCSATAGDHNRLLHGLTIRVGERVSGWCAANRRGAINSDATLDLGNIASHFEPPLRSTLATVAQHRDRLVGVLSAYSLKEEAFADSHRYTFERIVEPLGERLSLSDSTGHGTVLSFRGKA